MYSAIKDTIKATKVGDVVRDWETARKRVVRRFITRAEVNKRYFAELPCGLLVGFDIDISDIIGMDGLMSMAPVTTWMMDDWQQNEGVDIRTLEREAGRNEIEMRKLAIVKNVGVDMWCVSNTYRMYGAAVILRDDVRKRLQDEIGKEFYILPSSKHEVMCVRKDKANLPYLFHAVYDINRSPAVKESDFIADDVLEYAEDGTIVSCMRRYAQFLEHHMFE